MGRGTEAFPDLGAHCEHEDCNQLDFLPFTCDGCQKVLFIYLFINKKMNKPLYLFLIVIIINCCVIGILFGASNLQIARLPRIGAQEPHGGRVRDLLRVRGEGGGRRG